MALFANYVTFVQPADGSLGVQTITGIGFQGKALLLWSTLTPGHLATTAAKQLIAMTDGVAQSVRSIDHPGGGSTSAQAERTDCLVFVTDATSGATPTVRSRATFGAWTADGFTITWTTNTVEPLGGALFHALVLGGPDISVAVKQVKITTSTITVTGVGFEPDSFIVMGGAADETGTGDYNLGAPFGSIHGFGFSNATDNICSWTLGLGTTPSDTHAGLHTDRVASIRTANLAGAAELCGVTITATSGDGFTVSKAPGGLGQPVQHILCIKGALFRLGTFTAPVAPGTLTVPLTFRPGLFIAQTHASTTLNTSLDGLGLMMGAWLARVGQGGTWIGGTDNATPSVYSRSSYAGYLIQTRDPATRAVTCQASLTTATPTGVTLNFNVTAAMTFIYLALGSVGPAGAPSMFTTGGTTGPLSWIELVLKTPE